MPAARYVLGLACGQPGGSAEILLIEALQAAQARGAAAGLVRLDDLRLPSGPDAREPDDAEWFWEQLIACDALIISAPILSRTVPGRLKLLGDRLLGPNADAAIIEHLLSLRRAGIEVEVPFRVDERVLKPRVAGFLAVGGSLTPQWKALALPVLHTMTFSMSIAVVDQAVFAGAGTPRSIVLDPAALARAAEVGDRVASQLGRGLDDAVYLGDPGLCPLCHLNAINVHGQDVECVTCGTRGLLGNDAAIEWTDPSPSVIGMAERRAHAVEIQETAQRHAPVREEIEQRAQRYASWPGRISPSVTTQSV